MFYLISLENMHFENVFIKIIKVYRKVIKIQRKGPFSLEGQVAAIK